MAKQKMKTILIGILCLSLYVAAEVAAPFIAGVPGDHSKCAVSDGTYLYQGTNSDNGKIVKSRLDNLERVGELILNDAQFLCPSAMADGNLFFFAKKNGQNAIVKADTGLTTFTTTAVNVDASSYSNIVASGDSLYIFYSTNDGANVARVKQSDLSLVGTASIPRSALSGVVSDATNGDVAVLVGATIVRFALSSMTTIDSRPLPMTDIQAHAVKGNYLFLGVQSAVYRYDLDSLSNQQSITNAFGSNIVRAIKVDTDVHIYHRYVPGGRDPTPYPYNYIRATQEPFQLKDASAYVINATQINQPNFFNVFNDVTYFQYTGNLDPKPYAVPVLTRVGLDSTPKESFVYQQQGSEYLTRADVAQKSLIMTGSVGIMKVPLDGSAYSYATLPDGKTFTYGFREAAIISADETFGYYVIKGGVAKINLNTLTVAESKAVAFTSGFWTDAAVQSGNNLYFYYVQSGNGESSIIRYEYNSGVSTSPVVLSSNDRKFTLIYDSAVSADGQYLYMGTQSGADGKLWMIRFNFNTNTVDQVTELVDTYYVVGVAMDNLGQSLVVTTSGKTFKIDASTLAISASMDGAGFRTSAIQFEKSNQFVYIGGYTSGSSFNVFKINLASFTIVETYKGSRAASSRGAYDKCTDTVYMVGYESYISGDSSVPSNIGYIGAGGVGNCGGSTGAPSTGSPTSGAPSSAAPSSSPSSSASPSGSPSETPTASSGSNISGDNNARQSSSATRAFSMIGVLVAVLVIFL
jgi:hypothetical protein